MGRSDGRRRGKRGAWWLCGLRATEDGTSEVGKTESTTKPTKAGYTVQASSDEWIGARANWRQAELKKTLCPKGKARLGTWLSLGGNEEGFFQAGTRLNAKREAHTFYEKFYAGGGPTTPSEEPIEGKFMIEPGDRIYAEVEWRAGVERAYTFVVDRDEHRHQAFLSEPGKSSLYNGKLATFMGAER